MDRLRHFYVVRSFGRLASREGGVSRVEKVGNESCFRCVRRGCGRFQDGMDGRAANGRWLNLDGIYSGSGLMENKWKLMKTEIR